MPASWTVRTRDERPRAISLRLMEEIRRDPSIVPEGFRERIAALVDRAPPSANEGR